MKKIFAIFIGVAALHLLLLACVAFTGGCRNPEVLRQREYIPASPPVGPVETFEMTEPFVAPEVDVVDDSGGSELAVATTTTIVEEPEVAELPPLPEIKEEPVSHTVRKGESFWKIAKHYGVGMKELAEYNGKALNKPLKVGTVLKIPPGGEFTTRTIDKALNKALDDKGGAEKEPKSESESKGKSIKMDEKPAPEQRSYEPGPDDGEHVVQSGESLWKIAVMYNLKTKTLAEVNGLQLDAPLKTGLKLIIPGAAAKTGKTMVVVKPNPTQAPATNPAPTRPAANDAEKTEMVTLENELNLEDISDDVIEEITSGGDNSSLNAEVNNLLEKESAGTPTYGEHEVVGGDTWAKIAKQYGTTVEKIRQANPSLPDGEPQVGVVLKIP